MKPLIKLHPTDDVAIAMRNIGAGETLPVDGIDILVTQDVDKGHKVALRDIEKDEKVIKYGAPIGFALANIPKGTWVHTHCVKTTLNDELEYQYTPEFIDQAAATPSPDVNIYRRKNGEIGIRNEIWLIPTVGCVNGMIAQMKKEFMQRNPDLGIDGIHVFPHQFGCSQLGDDLETTRILLQNMVLHPNAGGALVVGLGCENNQLNVFKEGLGDFDENRVKFLITQQADDEIEDGVALLEEIYSRIKHDKREPGKLSEVKFGLECGGSDGLSGITANPMLGVFSDYLIAQGGTTVLTEVPEMFGAETLLMSRCKDEATFHKLVEMVNNFKGYYKAHNQPIYENPSPGNKKGGITTLEDKSLGCTQKAGSSKVQAVLHYGERLSVPGLNLLDAPGNDPIATSALGASGCHIVLFTTGRGTPYGGFVPTLKIATNSELAKKKTRWIDFDAGVLINDVSMEQVHGEFVDLLVEIVNGKETCNEKNDIREVAIWKKGVTL
ncbi:MULTISPECIES: UxaA family hydrolase [Pseudoalteromonas]|uniref:Altronate dehydratase n=1 Tax=Pseudoalteromonas fuliginea TaxID=1872678 RepID=A0A063KKP3_9GAMM|nr:MULTISPECIES: altronate dehydratase family protein [Pseudoalteromonas]AYK02502.1 UxaA [Pseudoalteromonas sp.]KAA1156817.1 altronate dehydratase [Pseudoalteromonas fuliginea]KAA1163787.1 altronate dehydratase [Pseudoalteromonas fuliginea]KAA1168901.1 altronate dehydratase [Pseudoalteromonas fuliginea]KDC48482.1 altronate hydrolase [Pseudoalteromonas fuliginea]